MQKLVKDAAGTPEAEPLAQGVTLSIPTHMAAPSHALILREGPKPHAATRPHSTRGPALGHCPPLPGTPRHPRGRDPGRTRRAAGAHSGTCYANHEPAGAGPGDPTPAHGRSFRRRTRENGLLLAGCSALTDADELFGASVAARGRHTSARNRHALASHDSSRPSLRSRCSGRGSLSDKRGMLSHIP
jgi:hypothetical protein